MNLQSKSLFFCIILALTIVTLATYYRVFIVGDYIIEMSIPCEPSYESCFVYDDCTDDVCVKNYYKTLIGNNAALKDKCSDPTSCIVACEIEGSNCVINHCDPQKEACGDISTP